MKNKIYNGENMMSKFLIPIIGFFISIMWGDLSSFAHTNWRMHPSFDEEVTHIIETPHYVYFTSRNLPSFASNSSFFLFRYDKEGEEILPLSTDNSLNGHLINDIVYNPDKGYLFILYNNYDIDLLYNSGKTIRIPYFALSTAINTKKVNSISCDINKDRVYLATDFGFIAINDKKHEIAESRIYNAPFQSFCRIGDYYFAIQNNNLLKANYSSPLFNLEEYEKVVIEGKAIAIHPLGDNFMIIVYNKDNKDYLQVVGINNGQLNFTDPIQGPFHNFDYNSKGLNVTTGKNLYLFKEDGNYNSINLPNELSGTSMASENLSEIWCGAKRKGLAKMKTSNGTWNVSHDFMMPNAPAVCFATNFAHHPDKGFLILNYGYTPPTANLTQGTPLQLSSLSAGRWHNHSPAYTNSDRTNICYMSNGMAIDPENPEFIYITSLNGGLIRLNLNDSSDIIHMSRANDSDNKNQGFYTLLPAPERVPNYANFSSPYFDKQGNLWMNHSDWDDVNFPHPKLYCWLATDRKNAIKNTNFSLPQLVEIDAHVERNNRAFVLPLLQTGNGLLLHVAHLYDESIILIDTKGTPTDTKDDKIYRFNEFLDCNGNKVEVRQVRFAWEDPATGYVWLGHSNGVCYIVPQNILDGNFEVNRIKVSRNDGTDLADYLLEGVTVNNIAVDTKGRKWFATEGAGVICTTADGREILFEFNSDNSPLPSNEVYGIAFNLTSNSMFFSTSEGLCEFMLPVNDITSDSKDIKIYPNPVKPDFGNYVSISEIPENSLVKIVDVSGNLVKDLGIMSGFEILWDVSDSSFNRVKSGVYYILVSPSQDNSSFNKVGKILVIN